ncbi:hypothetical protein [Algoriphagus sp.]|uniref:hypothetical protein n=1 Tax=Algoriphagus sp. TaxID=1872435 RepID=UPI0025E3C5D4|nr:hypothetical protein [Algoriphagus sp.]
MGLLDDLKHAASDVENVFDSIKGDLKKDIQDAEGTIKAGIQDFETAVKNALADAKAEEADLINKAKSEFSNLLGDLKDEESKIYQLYTAVKSKMTSDEATVKNIIKNLVDSDEKQNSEDFKTILTDFLTPIWDEVENAFDDLKSVSIGVTEEVSGVIGESEILSVGYKFRGDNDIRVLSDTGVSIGAEEGGEIGVFAGIWTTGPKQLKGSFLSLDLELDDGVGVGVKVYFDLLQFVEYFLGLSKHDNGFRGVIILGTAGEVAEADFEYTLSITYRIPD